MITVTAQAFDRVTGEELGPSRTEEIEASNELFDNVTSAFEIRQRYEAFWNDINPHSREVVFVSRVDMK